VTHLRKTTKADVLNLLMTYVHTTSNTRAKFSTHLKSQSKSAKSDSSAGSALVEALKKRNVSFDDGALQNLIASKFDLQAVKDFASTAWKKAEHLSAEAKTELESMISGLAGTEAGTKSEEEATAKLRSGNVYIDEIHAFKAGLIPSKAAIPLEPLKAVARL